jgi:predicted glycogen debranching enzyme
MGLPLISLDRPVLSDFESAIQREWLITNGLGGYASSTVLGINTRKYHGLLVAAVNPPRDRRVFLTKLDDEILVGDDVYQLGANEFKDVFFPQGHRFLEQFSVSPFPTCVYAAGNVEVQKTVFMPYEKNCVIALYRISNRNDVDVKMRVFPLVNWRSFHAVTDRSKSSGFTQEQRDEVLKMTFKASQSNLLIKTTEGKYLTTGHWIERVYLREEGRRGESCFDDCYQPGYFETCIVTEDAKNFAVIAVADESEKRAAKILREMPPTSGGLHELFEKERKRQDDFLTRFYSLHENAVACDWLSWLALATDAFLVKGTGEADKSVIAGYHWFGPWGRDTFISLPGLTLVTGRFDVARTIFLGFAKYCEEGLIPNFVPDEAEKPAYNTVDATLWYLNAVLQYLKYTGDFKFVKQQLWTILKNVIESHIEGTLFDIHLDSDGLLSHGPQLTWVDASVAGKPVLPRAGKAVEIQALWYNALKTMELLADEFAEGAQAENYAQMAEKARGSFVREFWNTEKSFLYDVVSPHGRDSSLRPNQIFAVSLDFAMLNNAMSERIVDVIQRELLTPCGLRTLARDDPRYTGVYSGDRTSRDKAYHSGTVWPWLLGPFTTAFLKVKRYSESKREFAFQNFLKPLLTQRIYQAGLGTLSEIFDGDPPHTPRGCIAQAWSVAESFRAYMEDVLQVRPQYEKEVLSSSS